jgi:tight adherence protein C
MDPKILLYVAFAALAAAPLVAVLAVAGRGGTRAAVDRTLATVERGYAPSAALADPLGQPFADRVAKPLAERLGRLGSAMTPGGAVARLQHLLDRAGNPRGWPADRVVATKGVGLGIGALVGFMFGVLLGGATAILLAVVVCGMFGFFAPDLAIYNAGLKRQAEIRRSLPDVLDTLTISVEAGQGFDAALAQVVRNGRGPIVGEAARVLQEMRIGKSRAEALRSLGTRTTLEELRGFAAAVIQAGELGVPIGQVLREQAKEMRSRRRQHAEELAQKVPVKILFPTLFCFFPAVFIVVIGPGIIKMIQTFAMW